MIIKQCMMMIINWLSHDDEHPKLMIIPWWWWWWWWWWRWHNSWCQPFRCPCQGRSAWTGPQQSSSVAGSPSSPSLDGGNICSKYLWQICLLDRETIYLTNRNHYHYRRKIAKNSTICDEYYSWTLYLWNHLRQIFVTNSPRLF